MKKSDPIVGKIIASQRKNNSVNGNPRFVVTISRQENGQPGEIFMATTSSDAAVGYDVENLVRSGEVVEIHFTRAGYLSHVSRTVKPTIVGYDVLLDDSAIVVEWSDGTTTDADPEDVLRWLIAGEIASR